MATAATSLKHRFIDIGVNLTDPVFKGLYRGSQKHQDDFDDVLSRGWDIGMQKMIITGGSLSDSGDALDMAKTNDRLFSTAGCHPTRSSEFEDPRGPGPEAYLQRLEQLIDENRENIVAYGECGLDYDRLHFCDKETQMKYFDLQLSLAARVRLPLFLHCRAAHDDFLRILTSHVDSLPGGVVHSFTGTKQEANEIVERGFYIGINGCSLKTADNLEVAKSIPAEKLMLETDAPWCEVRPTHAGHAHVRSSWQSRKKERWERGCMVKSRNEPAAIQQVLEVLAAVRGDDISELANTVYENTEAMFFGTAKQL